jgi:hypothetical protein
MIATLFPSNEPTLYIFYKLIRMTIRIPGEKYSKYSVISYKHRYVSGKEFDELTKYTAD